MKKIYMGNKKQGSYLKFECPVCKEIDTMKWCFEKKEKMMRALCSRIDIRPFTYGQTSILPPGSRMHDHYCEKQQGFESLGGDSGFGTIFMLIRGNKAAEG